MPVIDFDVILSESIEVFVEIGRVVSYYGATAAVAHHRRIWLEFAMAWKIEVVRKKLFIPLSLAMIFFLSGLIYTVYQLQWDHIGADTGTKIQSFHKNYQSQIQSETDLLNGFLLMIKGDKSLQQAWLAGNRAALLKQASPIFEELRRRGLVTHFYFITADKKCFLRVHKPESRDDIIDRTTMDIAAHLAKPAHGIEMGPFGTVALRVVHPWIINGRLTGYIELSEDVEQITARISRIMDIELLSVVDKNFLEKGKWEQGLRMSGRTANWDQYREFVVVSSNTDKKYTELGKVLDVLQQGAGRFMVRSDGRVLDGGFDASIDAAGNNIGRFIIISDVSNEEKSLHTLLLRLFALTLLISGLALAFFDWYISRIHFQHVPSVADGSSAAAEGEP